MDRLPTVTVITVTFNLIKAGRERNVLQCIESIHDQDYPFIEHLVIDGASTDGTLDLLRPYEEKGWLRIRSEPDEGIYDAMNKGVANSTGEFIAFLNSDDFWHDRRGVSASVEELEREKADFSFAPVYYLKEHDVREGVLEDVIGSFHTRMPCCHQSMFVRRRVFDRIGAFDTRYKSSADFDFILRMCLAGFDFVRVPLNFTSFRHSGLSAGTAANLGDQECIDSLRNNLSKIAAYDLETARRHFNDLTLPEAVFSSVRERVSKKLRTAMDGESLEKLDEGLLRVRHVPRIDKSPLLFLLLDATPLLVPAENRVRKNATKGLLDALSCRLDLELLLYADVTFQGELERLYATSYASRPNTHLFVADTFNAIVSLAERPGDRLLRTRCAKLLFPEIFSKIPPPAAEGAGAKEWEIWADRMVAALLPREDRVFVRLAKKAPAERKPTPLDRIYGARLFGISLFGSSKSKDRTDVLLFRRIPVLRVDRPDPRFSREPFPLRLKRWALLHCSALYHPDALELARFGGCADPVPALPICFHGPDFSIRRIYATPEAFHARSSRFVVSEAARRRLDEAFRASGGCPCFIDFRPEELTYHTYRHSGSAPLEFSRMPFLKNSAGFSFPESWGCWTDGPDVRFVFETDIVKRNLLIHFKATPALYDRHPFLEVKARVNGQAWVRWHFSRNSKPDTTLFLPAKRVSPSGRLAFEFRIDDPRSPAFWGQSPDSRRLGLAFSTVCVEPVL